MSLSVRKLLSLEKRNRTEQQHPPLFLKRRTKTTAATPQIQPSFWVGGEGGDGRCYLLLFHRQKTVLEEGLNGQFQNEEEEEGDGKK